jgi:hypothetical protein
MKSRRYEFRWVALLVLLQAIVPSLVLAQSGQRPAARPENAPAGLVNSVSGNVYARTPSGNEVLLKAGDVFLPGTTFRSGSDGNLVLLFADGQNISLGKDTSLSVDEYRFDAGNAKAGAASVKLLSGTMNVVTGAIHTSNPKALHISIGEVSIGILSKDVTAFIVAADPKSAALGFAAATVGEISVQTRSGTSRPIFADQFVRWQPGSPPSLPAPLAAAPAVFQAQVAASRARMLPSNGPIDVESVAIQVALATLPATGAGEPQVQNQQAQAVDSAVYTAVPAVTPGGGRGCVGSPC